MIHLTISQLDRVRHFAMQCATEFTEWRDNPPVHPTTPYEYAFNECIEGYGYPPGGLDYSPTRGISLRLAEDPDIWARVSIDDWVRGLPLLDVALLAGASGIPEDMPCS